MLRILGRIPRQVTVAFSGGVDSTAVASFLSYNHVVECAFFHHGTEASDAALRFAEQWCKDKNIRLHVGHISGCKPPELSTEEWWRDCRYHWLDQFDVVVTGHHLDDAVETWIWSSLHGCSKLIPYRRGNIIRPFLLVRKHDLQTWCVRHGVDWIEDRSNTNTGYTRNYIRHELLPGVLRVNPGIHTMIRKKLGHRGVT